MSLNVFKLAPNLDTSRIFGLIYYDGNRFAIRKTGNIHYGVSAPNLLSVRKSTNQYIECSLVELFINASEEARERTLNLIAIQKYYDIEKLALSKTTRTVDDLPEILARAKAFNEDSAINPSSFLDMMNYLEAANKNLNIKMVDFNGNRHFFLSR